MDIGVIRRDFPITRRLIYMNNASSAPMPISSIKAITDYILFESEHGPDSRIVSDRIEEITIDTRRRLSKMLRCKEEEIIFTQSTTDGINFVSQGLRLKKGDNIIIRDSIHEHPSNYIPWARLEDRCEVRRLNIDEDGSIDLEELEELIDDNTKVIALSHALFNTGLILPVEEVGKIAKKYNVPFFIDAAQTVGCLDVDLSKIDCNFLSFTGSKWLCGPSGIGVFYCRKDSQDMLEPLLSGFESMFVKDDKLLLKDIPDRFEAGFRNYIGIVGLNASLKYIMNVGIDNIRERNMRLADMLREGLKDKKVYGPEEDHKRTSIVSFALDDVDSAIEKLEKNNIIFAKRDISGKNIVRASPHFFNDEREVLEALNVIRTL
ncbi:MAG: aminotransferase class V-fold PLP-dependent enzyme [Candidatus Nitrosothermus koennekii]|nr:MAG: aminotransferase class V-fold PLP-dependent enzyme [Candidatus Nitrosothermus koennekii]